MQQTKYDKIVKLSNNYIAVRKGYRWGLFDNEGTPLMNIIYDYISYDTENGLWAVFNGNKFYVPTSLLPLKYDCIYEPHEHIEGTDYFINTPNSSMEAYFVLQNNKYGVMNLNYEIIIECKYDEITNHDNLFFAKNTTNDGSLLDIFSKTGKLLQDNITNIDFPIIQKKSNDKVYYYIIDHNYNIIVKHNNATITPIFPNKPYKSVPFHTDNRWYYEDNLFDIKSTNGYHYIYVVDKGLINIGYKSFEILENKTLYTTKYFVLCQRNHIFPTIDQNEIAQKCLHDNTLEVVTDVYYQKELLLSYNPNKFKLEEFIKGTLFICSSTLTGKYGLICNSCYKSLFIYDKIEYDSYCNIIIAYKENKLIDLYNEEGSLVNYDLPLYSYIENKKFYLSNLKIYKKDFDEVESFYHNSYGRNFYMGYAKVMKWNKVGIINSDGIIKIPIKFDKIIDYGTREIFEDNFKYSVPLFIICLQKDTTTNNNPKIETIQNKKYNNKKIDVSFSINIAEQLFAAAKRTKEERDNEIRQKRIAWEERHSYNYIYVCVNNRIKALKYAFISAKATNKGFYIVSSLKLFKYIDNNGGNAWYSDCDYYNNCYIPELGIYVDDINILDKHCFGKIDASGNEIYSCKYTFKEIIFLGEDRYLKVKESNSNKCVIAKDVHTNKIGLLNNSKQPISEFEYYSISEFNETGLAIIEKVNTNTNMLFQTDKGLISETGKVILPCDYSFIGSSNGFSYVSELTFMYGKYIKIRNNSNRYGIADIQGNIVVPCMYEQLDFFEQNYIKFYKDGLVGLFHITNYNKILLHCHYTKISKYKKNIEVLDVKTIYEEKNKYLIAQYTNGCEIFDINHESIIFSVYEEEATIEVLLIWKDCIIISINKEENKTYRIYSKLGKQVNFYFEYSAIGGMKNQYIQISKDKKWGIFDLNNHSELIPCKYFESSGYLFMTSKIGKKFMFNEYNNLALVDYEHKYGFINKQNIKIIDCKYDFAYPFKNGFCRVMINDKWQFLNKRGESISSTFDEARDFEEDFAAVKINDKWGFINDDGFVIANDFEEVYNFSDGFAAVKKNDKWGFINTKGELKIPFRFAEVCSFNDGLAAVAFKKRYGYIDKTNKTIIPFEFKNAGPFIEGIAEVDTNDEFVACISKNGDCVKMYKNPYYRKKVDYDDYRQDSWYAMTEGQYGDMPDGFDGDFDF